MLTSPRGQKSGVRLSTAFDKKAQDASLSQLIQQRLYRHPPVRPWRQCEHLSAIQVAVRGGRDQRAFAKDSRGPWCAEVAIKHHAKGLARVAVTLNSGRELRIVLDHCVDADKDRVVHVAELVSVIARLLACDPARLAGSRGDLAIERHGELQRHEWATGGSVGDVELVQLLGGMGGGAHVHLQTGGLEPLDSRAAHTLVRVIHRDHYSLDAR